MLIITAIASYSLAGTLEAKPVDDYSQVSPTVRIESYRLAKNGDIYQASSASATLISHDGLLLTNSHVVLDDNEKPYDVFAICLSYDIYQEPVCEYIAFLLGYDKNLDLALLKMASTDNRGNLLPNLPYYRYDFTSEVKVGAVLNIYGYSDIGGKNLTQTQGQVSGFDNEKGIKYLKTDADISSGNSGGTALDEAGNFVGVPTYVISSYENLGYVLDIKEAKIFIEDNQNNESEINQPADQLLKNRLNIFNDAKDFNYYFHDDYPYYSLETSNDWQFDYLDKTTLTLLYESNEGDKRITISTLHYPFKIPQSYIDELSRKLSLASDYLTDYDKSETIFAGTNATFVTYNLYGQKVYYYFIPYGYAQIEIIYSINLGNQAADLEKINRVLETFTFLEEPADNPVIIEKLINLNPTFSMGRSDDWYIQINEQPVLKDLIAVYHHPENASGGFKISYKEVEKEQKNLDNSEILEELIKNLSNNYYDFKLINKDESVLLDDLSGWSLTYSYEGDEAGQVKKTSEVYLRDGDYAYRFEFDDLADNYNKYLDDFKTVLLSFKNLNQPPAYAGQGDYQLGSLDYLFSDIQYHRFEQAITDLADKGVVVGYDNGTFRPEKLISNNEAITYIKNSISESKRTNVNESGADFLTVNNVTLKDMLKALVQVYQLNIWLDEYNDAPEWKPYLDKGYELNLIPQGLTDPNQQLTRAEFTFILSKLLESFKYNY